MTNSICPSIARHCRALLPALLLALSLPLPALAQQAPLPLARLQLDPACTPALAGVDSTCAAATVSGEAVSRNSVAAPTLSVRAETERAALRRDRGTARLIGTIAGFVIGAGATYFVLHSGGSTSLCDRDRNQDAIRARECAGLTVLGGAVGAGIGFVIGSAIGRDD